LERMPEDHVYQAYGIYLLRSQHRLIRRLKKRYRPSVHGHKTWNASFLLMDYLDHKPIAKGTKVLEIGCGWGPASVYCARRFKAKVTGLDIDRDVFPFLDVLAELNGVKVKRLVSKFENLKSKQLADYHTIVGSDVCFWDSMVKPLYQLINRAMKAGTQRIIVTDPGRPTFYELADMCSKKFKVKLVEWYAVEPERFEGEIVEITRRK
ncbi:MAG: methyltransferase domain-containing protein, partial [Gammaproteobacteria bacterium]|nr:methyltransferase domain-containing protein [Gammaproteobacteria bacterium]